MIHFATRHFERDEREQAWGDMLAAHCGPFEIKAFHDFDARMERDRVGDLHCARIVQNARYMRRSRRELQVTHQDYYYVMLQVAGQSRISQGGNEADMAPGNVLVLDSARALSMEYRGKNAHLCVHVPRTLLDLHGGRSPRIGEKLPGLSALLVGSLMQTAIANASALDEAHHQAMQESLLAVIRAALVSTSEGSPQDVAVAGGSRAVVQMVREYINQNLHSERLSPSSIARAHGMSVRHIHRLFKGSETSLAGLVRRSRLERCAADLRDATLRGVSVTEIAFRWGFNDSAHFSRAFKSEFGQTPRDYRAAAVG